MSVSRLACTLLNHFFCRSVSPAANKLWQVDERESLFAAAAAAFSTAWGGAVPEAVPNLEAEPYATPEGVLQEALLRVSSTSPFATDLSKLPSQRIHGLAEETWARQLPGCRPDTIRAAAAR